MTKADKERLIKITNNWNDLKKEIEKRNLTSDQLLSDKFIQWAVTTPLYNIGEHVSRLSPEFKAQYEDIPWFKIAGLRNRLVHNYEGTNWNIIVEVIFDDMPQFIAQIENIITSTENETDSI